MAKHRIPRERSNYNLIFRHIEKVNSSPFERAGNMYTCDACFVRKRNEFTLHTCTCANTRNYQYPSSIGLLRIVRVGFLSYIFYFSFFFRGQNIPNSYRSTLTEREHKLGKFHCLNTPPFSTSRKFISIKHESCPRNKAE